jgi:transposase
LLGVEHTVVEEIEFDDEAGVLVAHVRARKGARQRCGRRARRAGGFDQGEGRRRWRALDLGVVQVFLEADAPRVDCPEHGPTVVAMP